MWLMQEYGYAIVFVGTIFEGETIVALAGFAAYQEYLLFRYIIPIAILGAVIGDHVFFYLGRWKGKAILARCPSIETRMEKVHTLLARYHGWAIFGSRFMYGFRAGIPVILGMSKVSGLKFSFFNTLGAIVWAFFFTLGGYVFGGAIEQFLGNAKKIEGVIVLSVLLVVACTQLFLWLRRRKKAFTA